MDGSFYGDPGWLAWKRTQSYVQTGRELRTNLKDRERPGENERDRRRWAVPKYQMSQGVLDPGTQINTDVARIFRDHR